MNSPTAAAIQTIPTLQATWSGERLYIWGLRDAGGAEFLSRDELSSISSGLASGGSPGAADLSIPDAGGGGIRSASVSVLILDAAGAVDVLVALSAQDGRQAGRCGDSLHYWAGLARYVLSLLQRQQFVPDLYLDGESCRGRWRSAISSRQELLWLERYAKVMPASCRCAEGQEPDPLRLVETFVEGAVDGIARRILRGDEFFREIPARAIEDPRWELRWISSLISQDDVAMSGGEQARELTDQLSIWTAPLMEESSEPPPRLSFELEEPPAGSETLPGAAIWKLRLELSTATGAVLDVDEIWRQPVRTQSIMGSRAGNRRSNLEQQLRVAGGICPYLQEMLERQVGEVALQTAQAHLFMRQYAAALRDRGFDVDLPEWADQFQQRLALQLQVRPGERSESGLSLNKFGLGTLMEFNWRVSLGEQVLSLEEFEKLAARQEPLVRLGNRWLSLDQQDADRAIQFLRNRGDGQMTLAEAIRLAGGVDEIDAGLPIAGLSGADWVEKFLAESPTLQLAQIAQPAGFDGTLRPYQERGLSWLCFLDQLGIGACLADDMGLGKTIQLLALLLHERQAVSVQGSAGGAGVGPTLLFAPMSVVGNWEREIQRFAKSLKVLVHHGMFRLSGQAFVEAANRHDVVITTYGLAHRELEDLRRVQWHRVAMDEAQKIKNPTAAQTIALKGIPAAHRVALTGTPLENHLIELWSIMDALNPGLLGTATSFRSRFAAPIEKMGDPQRAEQLRRLIRPFVLRRLKSDPLVACDLPEKMEMRVFCNLTPEQAALYERTVQTMMGEIEDASGIRRRGLILATLTKLKQICNHPEHFLKSTGPLDSRSGKCERLVEMLEEVLEEGDAALIFTQYREMGDLLQNLICERLGVDILYLHGGTPMKKRNEMIERFQDEKSPERLFLLSLKAGGFGLNLTRANHVFHFDRWWNPAVEEQATDRVHRIGQTRKVQVHKFVCAGTVEERIDRLLNEKLALAEKIVGSGDEWLTGLSTLELREYLTLSKDAVAES